MMYQAPSNIPGAPQIPGIPLRMNYPPQIPFNPNQKLNTEGSKNNLKQGDKQSQLPGQPPMPMPGQFMPPGMQFGNMRNSGMIPQMPMNIPPGMPMPPYG